MNNMPLSHYEYQIVLGGLLGDASFSKKKNFIFCQSEKQKEYLEWKHSKFSKQHKSDIREREQFVYGKNRKSYYFSILNKSKDFSDCFLFLERNAFTNQRRKKISLKYLNELDALGLAVWWMDDGSFVSKGDSRWGKLCTHCFNYEEHILMKQYFKTKWDIDVSIKMEKQKYYFLRFNVKALKRLFSIIYEYVCEVPSMIYKIDFIYKNQNCVGSEYQLVYDYIKNKKMLYEGTLETVSG